LDLEQLLDCGTIIGSECHGKQKAHGTTQLDAPGKFSFILIRGPIKALDPVTAIWMGPWHTQFLSHLASLHTQAVCPPLFPPPPQTYKKDANV
jgi:hypothetical protein